MRLIWFLILTSLTISCANKTISKSGEIKTFAFDELRSGVLSANYQLSDMDDLKLDLNSKFKDATKYLPIYLKFENKNILYFSTTINEFIAYDILNNQEEWVISLPGAVTGMPVYSESKKIIYTLVKNDRDYVLISINLNGQITSQYHFNINDIYKNNGIDIKDYDLSYISSKTALGLNEINDQHYIYLGFSTPQNPYDRDPKKVILYGRHPGISGFLLAAFIENKNGTFLNTKPMVFFTSKSSHLKKGVDTGIYLAGGAPALLPNNTIIINTGNGPSYPEEEQYGCSVVRLDGNNFKPLKGQSGYSYLSKDLENFHECHVSNNGEFTSSWSSFVKKENNEYIGITIDKEGDIFIYNPERLSGNQKNGRLKLESKEFFGSVSIPIYSNGSIFNQNKNVTAIVHQNNNIFLMQSNSILGTRENANFFEKIGYELRACIGLIKIEGSKEDAIYRFYSGEIDSNFIYGKEEFGRLYEDQSMVALQNLNKNLTGFSVLDKKISFIKMDNVGYSVKKQDSDLNGYIKQSINLFAFHLNERFMNFSHFNDYNINYLSNDLHNQNLIFEYLDSSKGNKSRNVKIIDNVLNYYQSASSLSSQCFNPQPEKLKELLVFLPKKFEQANPPRKAFKIFSLDINQENNVKINWTFEGEYNEKIEKNGLVSFYNFDKSKMITLFNAINEIDNKSYVYILNSKTGEKIKKFEVEGKLHFSTLAIIDEGILVPTDKNGLKLYRFN